MTLFPIFFAEIENDLRRVLAYSLNNQLVVGIKCCGGGGTQAETILSFFGISVSSNIRGKFTELDNVVGQTEQQVKNEVQAKALEMEKAATRE